MDVPKPSNDPANRASSATQSSLLADVDVLTSTLPALTMCDDPAMFTNVTHSRAPPASNRESNNHTTKAHKVLDSIEKRVRTLLRSSPSSRQLRSDVEGIRRALHNVRRQADSVMTCKRELTRLCDELEERVIPEEEDDDPMDYDSSHHFNLLIDDCNETAQVSLLLAAVSMLVLGVGHRAGEFFTANGFPRPQLTQIPKTIPASLSRFSLEPHTTVYAVCPACNCTYKPRAERGKYSYPTLCTNIPRPGADICNAMLVKDPEDGCKSPIKTFVYHHFHDYIAALLARPGLEEVMDKPCDRLAENPDNQPTFLRDVWDGISETEVARLNHNSRKQIGVIQALLLSAMEDYCDDDSVNVAHYISQLGRKLRAKNTEALQYVAEGLGVEPMRQTGNKVRKAHWVDALLAWRQKKPMKAPPILQTSTPEVMQRIQQVIKDTHTPSWVRSVPHNFGDARAGTLKADEWRTMVTIYLPLALISLWG
ncbi:hypothetical protein EDD15DRAFT_2380662 [Pisolithus albus]|nr:hypothetical protein EDD15DRAFT_2380662 [Pisolithus albus]